MRNVFVTKYSLTLKPVYNNNNNNNSSGPFLKLTKEELQQMGKRTRKFVAMHKALHPRDDVDRLYVSRKEGGSVFTNIKKRRNRTIKSRKNQDTRRKRNLHILGNIGSKDQRKN